MLVATKKDFEPANRKKFCSRIATGDYDAVVIGHMRILLKVLLFPVVLVLTVLVAFCRFICLFSGMILGILAVLLFLIGLLVLFAGRVDGFIGFMILAWLVSPYGLPMAASWLTERVADFNRMLKSI